jgi:hypothetical protein
MGNPIATDQAWRKFADWKNQHREIGVIYFSTSGTMLYTIGLIDLARNGGLRLKGDVMKAAFNLRARISVMGRCKPGRAGQIPQSSK